ncbi:MAG: serine hydrolase domain-containing protein [Longimicrobiaceae bacterium]
MSLLAAVPLLLALAHPAQQPDPLARERVAGALGARLDARLTRYAAYGFSGTVLVACGGEIVLLKGYGLADVEHGVRNTAETRFEMNSMTKMFTAAAVLQLAARGRLRLDDPAARYLPGFSPEKRGATLEQLASHTAGLVVEGSDLAGESRDAFVRDVARTPRESAPGERYRYTNAGYSLLAAVIETVSGERYEEYLRRNAFAPAGMRTALFRDEVPAGDRRFAHGYVGTPAALRPGPPNPYVWGTIGAGGVWSTVGDVYRWVAALESGRILPPEQWRLLTSRPRPPSDEAFGWHVETDPAGRPRMRKGGGSDDFASELLYYPRDRVVVVWASNNLRQRWRQTIDRAIPALVFGEEGAVALPPVARVTLAARGGRFAAGTDTVALRPGPGYLYALENRLGVPANVMFYPQDGARFTAFDPALRAVTRLELTAGSAVFTLADGRRVAARRVR